MVLEEIWYFLEGEGVKECGCEGEEFQYCFNIGICYQKVFGVFFFGFGIYCKEYQCGNVYDFDNDQRLQYGLVVFVFWVNKGVEIGDVYQYNGL